jgi:flagellar biosynthesis/type III secretory pathway chaperone
MGIEQRLDVLEILTRSVIHQENEELCKKLSRFRGDDVQWVLNEVATLFECLQDSLDLEAGNLIDY